MEKAKGRLQVESFSKISAPFYKMFYDFDLAELRSKQFAIILAKLDEMDTDLKKIGKFPLVPMGVLAPGSVYVRPSARSPIDTSGNFLAHISRRGAKIV